MKTNFIKKFTKLFVFISVFLFCLPAHSAEDKLSQDDLDQLIAPIALYPDPLLAQILPASTYPLEIVEAARIIKDKDDFSKIDSQDWDASVKAVAHYPNVLKMMNDDLDWTQKLGQAVINQQDDVMSSIQNLREKAKQAGHLKTTKEQVVTVVEKQIEIIPANPEIIYVPVYNPRVVFWGPVVYYPYPVITYGVGWRIGGWLNIGFYWPVRSIFYCGPHYWHAGWHDTYVHNTTIINNTHVTNIYRSSNNNVYQKNSHVEVWSHNARHGNPFNGLANSVARVKSDAVRNSNSNMTSMSKAGSSKNSTFTSKNSLLTSQNSSQNSNAHSSSLSKFESKSNKSKSSQSNTKQSQDINVKKFQSAMNHIKSDVGTNKSKSSSTKTTTFSKSSLSKNSSIASGSSDHKNSVSSSDHQSNSIKYEKKNSPSIYSTQSSHHDNVKSISSGSSHPSSIQKSSSNFHSSSVSRSGGGSVHSFSKKH